MIKLKALTDGFKNILKGIGTEKDGRSHTRYVKGIRIDQYTADNLYTYNWLAAQVVDAPIDDATRKWRDLLISDSEIKEKVEESFKVWKVKEKINLAMKWGRVFGGAVILMIIDGQDQTEPLDIKTIKKDSLTNLIVLDRYNIYPHIVDRNILSPNYGEPETYTVVRGGQEIHHTRIIKFDGKIPTIREYELQNFWGVSIFTDLFDPIKDSQTVSNSINSLVMESNVDVYRIAGLNAMVSEGKDALVVKRLKLAHAMKSIINGIALDKEDEYDKKVNSFTELANIDDRFIQKVSGASNIPVTRLLGTSPSGQNSTGEADMRNYYDNVSNIQENKIRPKLDILDVVIMSSTFGDYEKFQYIFNPLQQVTETEKSDIDLKTAQMDQIYKDMDVITDIDVMSNLASNGTYVSVDATRVDEEEKLFKEEDEPFVTKEPEDDNVKEE